LCVEYDPCVAIPLVCSEDSWTRCSAGAQDSETLSMSLVKLKSEYRVPGGMYAELGTRNWSVVLPHLTRSTPDR
jgi:hypothetical protein